MRRLCPNLLILVGLPSLILLPAGTSIVLPVGYMDQPSCLLHMYLWRRLCGRQGRWLFRTPLQEVIWITSLGGYVYLEVLKITAPTVFNQRFEPGTLGSGSQCSSTVPRWDLYFKEGDNVVNAKGRANEIGQSWCPADLLDFQSPIDPMQTHVA